jgi:putative PIN family toxin of toxin-antitoxin system
MFTRIVMDTSVIVSALIGETGPAREVLRRCLRGEYQPVIGNALFTEYEDVLSRPHIQKQAPISVGEIRELMNAFYSVSVWVPIYFLFRPNLRDEGDNHVLELAVAGQASRIVTNNLKDFKNPQLYFPDVEILSPEMLLRGERNGDLDD